MLNLSKLAGLFFGCRHRNLSRPMSLRNPSPGIPTRPAGFVVCLDCGTRFRYDFDRMRIGEALAPDPPEQ